MSSITHIGVRVGFVALALVVWFWSQRVISAKAPANNGVGDRIHDWSAPLHRWLLANTRATNLTLIITSLFVDLFGLTLLASAVFGSSVQPFLAILIVFAMRQICQLICTLPIPPGAIWRDPGFPSLLVTYGTSNDFFFSGHTAISVLGALFLWQAGPPWLAALGIVIAALEAITVIILRAHYTMDVFAALFAAWGANVLACHLAPAVDVWLGRLTPL